MLSAIGAKRAVEAVLDLVERASKDMGSSAPFQTDASEPATALMRAAFQVALRAIESLAEEEGRSPDRYATTLAVAVLTPEGTTIGQIGDGIVVVRLAGGSVWHSVQPQERYEYANETDFITSVGAVDRMRSTRFDPGVVEAIALSTDGLRYKILDVSTGEPYQPFFDYVFHYAQADDADAEAVAAFMGGLDDQTGDDKTLVVAVRGQPREGRIEGPDSLREVTEPAADMRDEADTTSGAT